MAELLLTVCAIALIAVFVRVGRLARALEVIRLAQEPPPASEQISDPDAANTRPMSELRGPRTLEEMRRYFYHASTPHQWDTPDPTVAEGYEQAEAKRKAKD